MCGLYWNLNDHYMSVTVKKYLLPLGGGGNIECEIENLHKTWESAKCNVAPSQNCSLAFCPKILSRSLDPWNITKPLVE